MRASIDDSGPDARVRARWGIPLHARRVLVLAESTHWDPGWLLTSDQYYRFNVRKVLDRAVEELLSDPARVYNLECLFYLRMYWEQNPGRADDLRRLINEGRLRLSAPGITTPDTLLATDEALLRDMLLGFQWLREQGCRTQPRVLYLPDSFGHTPGLPTLARAAGLDRVAFTRIDGMYFAGAEREPRDRFPRRGSSAEVLLQQERTLDFVWRDANGSEVLAHWNAFGYGQGDMIAAKGISRWMGVPFLYRPARSEPEVRARIEGYVADLAPVSRTPYLLCPIGSDFVPPVPDLRGVIEQWNRGDFDRTGVWVLNGSLDHYFDLVEAHRSRLPVIELDPNPYWMGFYASRLQLKQRIRRLEETISPVELDAAAGGPAAAARARELLREPNETLAFSNHHDFITGTSPDRVIRREQQPLLLTAQQQADLVAAGFAATAAPDPVRPVTWSRSGDRVVVRTPGVELVLDAARGGCVMEATDRTTSQPLVRGPAFDLVAWRDSGGLWRMGNEFPGGRLHELDRTSRRPAAIRIEESVAGLRIEIDADLDGRKTLRSLWFGEDLVGMTTTVGAAGRRMVTLRVPTPFAIDVLAMAQPGGVVRRPAARHYHPTFWPVFRWAAGLSNDTPAGLAVAVPSSTAVATTRWGGLDVVVARNANQELSWGFLPFRGMPARGREPGDVTMTTTWWLVARDDPVEIGKLALPHGWADAAQRAFPIDREDVVLSAARGAADGRGVVVRLRALGRPGGPVRIGCRWPLRSAVRCDALERDIEPLRIDDGWVVAEMGEPLLTVRLVS